MGFEIDSGDDQAVWNQLMQERQQRAVEAARRILKDAPMDDVRVLTDEIGITELVFVKGKQ